MMDDAVDGLNLEKGVLSSCGRLARQELAGTYTR